MNYATFKTILEEPSDRTLTLLANIAKKYGVGKVAVKNMYFRCLFDHIQSLNVKATKVAYELALSKLGPDDFRQIWYCLNNKCQAKLLEEKPDSDKAKDIAEHQELAKKILAKDVKRLKLEIAKLKVKKFPTRYEREEAKSRIEKYEEFVKKASNPKSLGHYTQKVMAKPTLKSFIFTDK